MSGPCFAAPPPVFDPVHIDWAMYDKLWVPDIAPATADEPKRPVYDPELANAFLDDVSVKWSRHNKCGTCHTSLPYLMATRFVTTGPHADAVAEVRNAVIDFANTKLAKPNPFAPIFVVPATSALVIQDARSDIHQDQPVQELVQHLWRLQDADGSWHYPADEGFLPFLERDRTYIALLVALAAGYSPDLILEPPTAQAGMQRLKSYIQRNKPESVHHQAVLLWASTRTAGLLTNSERTKYQQALLRLQKSDGGWALPSLGFWPRYDGPPNDPHAPSDGYATALATLVLCERGLTRSPAIGRARDWLEHNQRQSGRWYTPSLFSDRFKGYLSNMATAYATMALESCARPDSARTAPPK